MNKVTERLYNGIIKENPTFVLTLGMCPTLAVTTSAMNGLGMGLSTTVVLALSNLMISALRKIIPDKVRIPAFPGSDLHRCGERAAGKRRRFRFPRHARFLRSHFHLRHGAGRVFRPGLPDRPAN